MKKALMVLVALIGVANLDEALAQSTLPSSPDIHPNGSVTFQLKAPGAGRVVLNGDWPGGAEATQAPMVKDDQGVWSVTVGPIKPDLWTYTFNVDGVKVPDDLNPHLNYDRWGSFYQSLLLIPGGASYNYELHDVPHGTVADRWYPAPTMNIASRRAIVYTPAGYEAGHDKYPVLYLSSNEESGWVLLGRAPIILDNLIAAGKAKPMIVVMLNTQPDAAVSTDLSDEELPSTKGRPSRFLPERNADGGRLSSRASLLGGLSIADDLVPFIDANYRTKADRDHRAVAGMSSSGASTFYGGMANLKVFASIGLFSGGFPTFPGAWTRIPDPPNAAQFMANGPDINQSIDPARVAELMPAMNSKANLRLLYFAVGTNDSLINSQRIMTKLLDDKGLKYVSLEVPGYHHEWRFWRWCLADFSSRLF